MCIFIYLSILDFDLTDIEFPLQVLLKELDPTRYYVQSSMSPQSSDPASFDVDYALAAQVFANSHIIYV